MNDEMLIVDRIEGGLAVCEAPGRVMRTLPLAQLPPGVREGDCLRPAEDGYTIDQAETARRRAANQKLLQSLLADGDEG